MTQRQHGKTRQMSRNSGQLIMSPAGVGLIIQRQLLHPPLFAALSSLQGKYIARVRMVVVRGFDIRTMTLQTSADSRTAKMAQLQAHRKSELCLWLPELATQLRLLASWRAITQEGAGHSKQDFITWHKLWQGYSGKSRNLFTGPHPGRPVAMRRHALPNAAATENTDINDPPANFAVLVGRIESIDALYLAQEGHQRYRHRRIADRWETLKINA